MDKKILGLDLGTNSIGWALVNGKIRDDGDIQLTNIEAAGSRIIPMDAAILGDFDKGNSISQTANRTGFRGVRRIRERYLLRRERLHRILNLLGFLPQHYADELNRYGQFLSNSEPKLAWRRNAEGKHEFIFMDSFYEMLEDFRKNQPSLIADDKKVPLDWTIYYLRKKALYRKITKEELAWILLNFNQKRGYFQLRGEEDEEIPNKLVEYYSLKVVSVEDSGDKKGKDTWYNVHLENGWIYRRPSSVPLDWVGKTKDFVITTDLEKDGSPKTDKDGNVKRSFRAPKEDDWGLLKTKTQAEIEQSHETVGAFIYDTLLRTPRQKIKGKLVRTIERKFYKDELTQILTKQIELHEELQDKKLYQECLFELYSQNEAYRNSISNRDFAYLFINDIIFYQRPLKSKKSLIDDCPYEEYQYVDKETGEMKKATLKCIAKSHPLFQEFRLWQFLANVHIFRKGVIDTDDKDVTADFLKNENDFSDLFDWLNDRKDIDQKTFLGYPSFGLKKQASEYRWNYVEDKLFPCNETRALMLKHLEKAGIKSDFLSKTTEEALWHILYSIENKQEIEKALKKFAAKYSLPETFVQAFSKCPPFKKEYGAYSAKAIKKLLPFMRMGKYWNEGEFDINTRERINKICTGEYDENIKNRVREKSMHLTDISQFKALPLWLACYIVYNRHSEAKDIIKWETPEDLNYYIKGFKQHSLRNPIVEQVIMETLRTVRDIWIQAGAIDEIHVELGREMKNSADKRAKMTQQIQENENTNLRIKALLSEFINPEFNVENVRPFSPSQQELLKIYEDGVLHSGIEIPEDMIEIMKKLSESDAKKRPTHNEILRYKLWLEQKYRSPYTGEIIPLGKLFTPAYEIEHIIPQSRYFDDSLSNKVICESEVNKLKDRNLGLEFIKIHHGEIIPAGNEGRSVKIFSVEEYEQFVKDHFANSRGKMKKLMLEDIPESFIERQMNDSRYISKVVKTLLSNVVREKDKNGEYEQEAVSKNLISSNGEITDRQKRDWGINDVWNHIILPRFQRLNEMTGTHKFTSMNNNGNEIPMMPLEFQKGFNKKRIDHRHHAMDAIMIACANRNIVNYLNNESASKKSKISRYDLQSLLCEKARTDDNGNYRWILRKPWTSFTQDVRSSLKAITVSFKQNLRVINKTENHYLHYENGEKKMVKQEKGESWAIRKPMHKETVFGEVNLQKKKFISLNEAIKQPKSIVEKDLRKKILELIEQGYDNKKIKAYFDENKEIWEEVNTSKVEIYYYTKNTKERFFATRKAIDESFDENKIKESITDTGAQKIMLRHLQENGGNPTLAFSPDGIDQMNRDIVRLNDGKFHQPILKVRVYEKAEKFAVGQMGNKSSKFVEAAKGTNLFFAVYEKQIVDEKNGTVTTKRSFASIPLNVVIERQKQGLSSAPENEEGQLPAFTLSPNDVVYLPTEKELAAGKIIEPLDKDRIYKMVSCTGNRLYCIPYYVANSIIDKYEFTQLNKLEFTDDKKSIKEICIPIKVDRLGNISL